MAAIFHLHILGLSVHCSNNDSVTQIPCMNHSDLVRNIKNFRFLLLKNVQMTTFIFMKTWSPPVLRLTLWGAEWYILNICHAFNIHQLQARQVLFVDSMQSGFLKIIRICFSRLGRSRWVGNPDGPSNQGHQGPSRLVENPSTPIVQGEGHLLFPNTKVDQRHK